MYRNAILILLFGLVFAGIGTALSYQPVKLLFKGIAIEGIITEVQTTTKKNSDGKYSTSYLPKIEYECNESGKMEQRASFSSNHPYRV